MFTEEELTVLDVVADVYPKDGTLLVMDKIFDSSYRATKATIGRVLRNILSEVPQDVAQFILNATPEERAMTVIADDLLTYAYKIPKGVDPLRPSQVI